MSEYKVQTKEGHGAWRVVGRYGDSYQGHPGFIRNKFVNFEGMHLKVTLSTVSLVLHSRYTFYRIKYNLEAKMTTS